MTEYRKMPMSAFRKLISTMSRDELLDLKLELEDDQVGMNNQINAAKASARASGEYADPEWFASVVAARRHNGQRIQAVTTQLSKIGHADTRARAQEYEKAFVDAAKQMLREDTFVMLHYMALEAIET